MIDVCALAAARPDSPAPVDAASSLSRDNAELIAMTEQMLAEAGAQGQLRSSELKQIQITCGAPVYGFARMNIDRHFPRRGVADAEAERMAEAVLDVFIGGITRTAAT